MGGCRVDAAVLTKHGTNYRAYALQHKYRHTQPTLNMSYDHHNISILIVFSEMIGNKEGEALKRSRRFLSPSWTHSK